MKLIELLEDNNSEEAAVAAGGVAAVGGAVAAAGRTSFTFTAGDLFPLDSGRSGREWALGLGNSDEILVFDNREKAGNFLRHLQTAGPNGGPSPLLSNTGRIRDNLNPQEIRNLTRIARTSQFGATVRDMRGFSNTLARLSARSQLTAFGPLNNLANKGPTLTKILSSRVWSGLFTLTRVIGAFAGPVAIIATNLNLINTLETEANTGEISREEGEQLRNILISQTFVQVGIILYATLRTSSYLAKGIRVIRNIVRAIQATVFAGGFAAALGTGGTSLAASAGAGISFLVTEAIFIVIPLILSSETIQRSIAEMIQESMFADIFAAGGAAFTAAVGIADQALDGALGTRALRRMLGFEEGSADDTADGEVWASSEWAKLVFHNLIFPSNEKVRVPYINPDDRETALFEKLNITSALDTDAPETPTPAETPTPRTGATAPGDMGDGFRGSPVPAPTTST